MTSHDVVNRVRRIIGVKRVGHGGTLDPDATGVLPVLVGKATRLSSYVLNMDKSYIAEMTLGIVTDTQDASGEIVTETAGWSLTMNEVRRVAGNFVGGIQQVPPMVSAIKIGGKRLHELARKNIEIQRPPRPVTIYSLLIRPNDRTNEEDLLGPGSRVVVDVACSKGTYVRTLCDDIGRVLGCGAHMSSLIRTRVGPFHIDDSISINQLQRLAETDGLDRVIVSPTNVLDAVGMACVAVNQEDESRLRHGQAVPPRLGDELIPLHDAQVYDAQAKNKTISKKLIEHGDHVYVVNADNSSMICIARFDDENNLIVPTRVF